MFKFVSENRKKIISGQGQQNQFIVHHLLAVLETDMDSKVWHGKATLKEMQIKITVITFLVDQSGLSHH